MPSSKLAYKSSIANQKEGGGNKKYNDSHFLFELIIRQNCGLIAANMSKSILSERIVRFIII